MDSPHDQVNRQPPTLTALNLAAQADLLLLCADLLRPPTSNEPRPSGSGPLRPAEEPSVQELRDLCAASGLGDAAALNQRIDQAIQTRRTALLSEEHTRLFDARQACPLNQTAYIRRDKGAILGDLCGFYRAFGFTLAATGEKADHLVTELEFLAMLLSMQAAALQDGNAEQAEIAHDAARRFMETHLNDWVLSACVRLEQTTASEHYLAVAACLGEFWQQLAAIWAIPPADAVAPVNVEEIAQTQFECGSDAPLDHGGQRPGLPLPTLPR